MTANSAKYQKFPAANTALYANHAWTALTITVFGNFSPFNLIRINQCVGAKNYKFFLSYIFLHTVLTGYAGVLGVLILIEYVQRKNLINAKFYSHSQNQLIQTNIYTVIRYVIAQNYTFFSSIVMLLAITITLGFFTCYHVYLIWKNFTTAESMKRNKIVKFMEIVKKTLKKVLKERNFENADNVDKNEELIGKIQLKDDEIKKYIEYCFKDDDFDVDNLQTDEVLKFVKFTNFYGKIFEINQFYKGGFIPYLKEIFNE